MVFVIFASLIFVIDLIELLRKASSRDISMLLIIEIGLLKLPFLIQTILPFIVLITTVLSYSSLNNHYEMIILKSSGISIWEFTMPVVIAAFLFGIFTITAFNPLACYMLNKHEYLKEKYLYNAQNSFEMLDSGLWIRQEVLEHSVYPSNSERVNGNNEDSNVVSQQYNLVIYAQNLYGKEIITLNKSMILGFTPDGRFAFRVDSDKAELYDGFWFVQEARMTFPDGKMENISEYKVSTNIKKEDIKKSFASPETISFWQMPSFIEKLQNTGFSPVEHKLQFWKLVFQPFYFIAMVLFGVVFSLQPPRKGKSGMLISLSIVSGFVIYFVSNFIFSMGLTGVITEFLANLIPVLMVGFIATTILLYNEDG